MYKSFVIIFFLLTNTQVFSQMRNQESKIDSKKAEENRVYNRNEVDKVAHFPNEKFSWKKYLIKKSRYNKFDKKFQAKGKVYLSFIVEKDGSVSDAVILRGLNSKCDEDALWLIRTSKKWVPALSKSKIVRSKVHCVISYGFD